MSSFQVALPRRLRHLRSSHTHLVLCAMLDRPRHRGIGGALPACVTMAFHPKVEHRAADQNFPANLGRRQRIDLITDPASQGAFANRRIRCQRMKIQPFRCGSGPPSPFSARIWFSIFSGTYRVLHDFADLSAGGAPAPSLSVFSLSLRAFRRPNRRLTSARETVRVSTASALASWVGLRPGRLLLGRRAFAVPDPRSSGTNRERL